VILKKLKYNNFIIYKKFPSFPRFGTKLTKYIYYMISQLFTIQEENLFLIKVYKLHKILYINIAILNLFLIILYEFLLLTFINYQQKNFDFE
jgi:hypothetical protein